MSKHHMGGFGGFAAFFIVFLFLFLVLGGPLMKGCARALNAVGGGAQTEDPVQ